MYTERRRGKEGHGSFIHESDVGVRKESVVVYTYIYTCIQIEKERQGRIFIFEICVMFWE